MNTSNFINLIGRVGQAPNRATLNSGRDVLEFSLATNDTYKDRDGNRVTRTEWHRIKCYGPVVDILDRYVNKGDQISIVGTLRYRDWTDKHDQKHTAAEVILDSFSFIGGNRREPSPEDNNPIHAGGRSPLATAQPTYAGDIGGLEPAATSADVDLPF